VLPETDLARVHRWVAARNEQIPPEAKSKIRVEAEVTERAVTIVECSPPWDPELGPDWLRVPVARLRYTKSSCEWSLFWPDRNSKFHAYDAPSTTSIAVLLDEIDADPTCIFWG
jgi:hypothetical protein